MKGVIFSEMSVITNFFRRAKRKLLRDSARTLRNCYQDYLFRDEAGKGDIMLNIGAGNWHCEGWTNLDYPSEWYAKAQAKHSFIPYDIRSDSIPFEPDSVKAVYCSHVIEHIEDKYVYAFFTNVHKILRGGGVLRIACPDAEFLYQVSKFNNEYWHWRNEWFKFYGLFNGDPENVRQVDYLVSLLATPRLQGYINGTPKSYEEEFAKMSMNEFFSYITEGLEYRKDFPGDHINFWTFEKVKAGLEKAGFSTIIRSKYGASICRAMCNLARFDTTYPMMSLYVEAVK